MIINRYFFLLFLLLLLLIPGLGNAIHHQVHSHNHYHHSHNIQQQRSSVIHQTVNQQQQNCNSISATSTGDKPPPLVSPEHLNTVANTFQTITNNGGNNNNNTNVGNESEGALEALANAASSLYPAVIKNAVAAVASSVSPTTNLPPVHTTAQRLGKIFFDQIQRIKTNRNLSLTFNTRQVFHCI